jgi:hypothetical protein
MCSMHRLYQKVNELKGGLLHPFQPISVLHRMQKLKGEYLESCDDCVAAHQLCIKEGRPSNWTLNSFQAIALLTAHEKVYFF